MALLSEPKALHYKDKKDLETKIEPLVEGVACKELVSVIVALLQNEDNVLVISSDLSHFHPLKEANSHDNICLSGVSILDPLALQKGCEACGIKGIEAMIKASKKLKLKSKLLDYRTSAHASGDEKSVVGYLSAMFY